MQFSNRSEIRREINLCCVRNSKQKKTSTREQNEENQQPAHNWVINYSEKYEIYAENWFLFCLNDQQTADLREIV